ncbi:MAG: peptide ABC transporter substrate-binding protein [Alphaproteobacteria bacterium HGW-Alphaproteobacteria-8]|jgi:peptide/nickel transport system substrate-binding protein|nr:MAG: peptide ABC transporter substrate-binding protein [Alphaproteobacteria bacterium HGW-Alphaproteobacteria-8]
MKHAVTLAAAAAAAFVAASADAATLRWARTQEALTLDPHAQNEGPTTTLAHQMYEPLVMRDHTGAMVAALATDWAPSASDPNAWIFSLRKGVKYHDGAEFTADDVVFSLNRARHPDSNYKELLSSVVDVVKVDDHTVSIVTNGPNPILPANLTNIMMMDQGWAQANNVEKPQNFAAGEDNFAARNTNGTGPYVLVSREPDTKTVLRRNEAYWGLGEFPLDVTEIVFTPIKNPATRVAALLSGEVDFIQDVPVQDLDRVAGTPGLVVGTTPQNRTIFFGLNVGADDLSSDDVAGKNPFADVRVREAMNIAINRDAIKQVVMRGQSQPTGVIMPPFVNGWTAQLDAYPAPDVASAKALLAEAGYPGGFSARLDCPNDRYINDEAICQAAVGMLGQIGIKVQLEARPRAQHFPLIANGETDFYLLGWGVPTYDSEYIFNFLVHTRTDKFGSWNATGFSDAALDARIEALASNVDLAARDAEIAALWTEVQALTLYLPIHHQVLNWGLSSRIATLVEPEDAPKIKYFQMTD